MWSLAALGRILLGNDARMQRLMLYGLVSAILYLFCSALLWGAARGALVPHAPAMLQITFNLCGVVVFYLFNRFSDVLRLPLSQLAVCQSIHTVTSVAAAYAIGGPVRGAMLLVLPVLLLFVGLPLQPRHARWVSLMALGVLGAVMLGLTLSDPLRYPPLVELFYFVMLGAILAAVTFMTAQFSRLRSRLKAQNATLRDALHRIESLATHDELTQLVNRSHMVALLRDAQRCAGASGQPCSIALIDLDLFKHVNDNYGQQAGDRVLREFAGVAQAALGRADLMARWGGAEFLLLMPGADVAAAARALADMQVKLDMHRFDGAAQDLRVTFSGGVTALAPQECYMDAIQRADQAMLRAKGSGRNAIKQYTAEHDRPVMPAAMVAAGLRRALTDDELVLHFQPQTDRSGTVVGCETLVRWQHPQLGTIPPGEFIAIAEKTDLIVALGHWVLERACQHLVRWQTMPGLDHLHISVNVSARQFRHPQFLERVLGLIAASGIDASRLHLELTESMLVDALPLTIATMRRLREAGVCMSLDDFGTGYASLSYLKQLPLDELKIDRAFVTDVERSRHDAAIARAIIALGHSLGLSVVAEGVETVAQHDFLLAAGCNRIQGYLVSRPLPIAQFEHFVGNGCTTPRLPLPPQADESAPLVY